ncbi:MAG TPA: hypothetical protein VGH65_00475 [Verrucomicrobiaceae bacterium]
MKHFLALMPCLLLASCGFNSAVVSLDYQPHLGQNIPGPRVVSIGRFSDMRTQDDFKLGTVRSPIGTPLETLKTRVPMAAVARNAFAHGLKARGMLAAEPEGAYVLTGEVYELECYQMLYPVATAKIRVNIMRRGSGEITYSRVYQARRSGETYAPGSGSPVQTLTDIASRTLQQVVDQALDDRELRKRLRTPRASDTPR